MAVLGSHAGPSKSLLKKDSRPGVEASLAMACLTGCYGTLSLSMTSWTLSYHCVQFCQKTLSPKCHKTQYLIPIVTLILASLQNSTYHNHDYDGTSFNLSNSCTMEPLWNRMGLDIDDSGYTDLTVGNLPSRHVTPIQGSPPGEHDRGGARSEGYAEYHSQAKFFW